MTPQFADPDTRAIPIQILPKAQVEDWFNQAPARDTNWAKVNGFNGRLGQTLRVPNEEGETARVLLGWGVSEDHARTRFAIARAVNALKSGTFRLEGDLTKNALEEAALGWLLSSYSFERYAKRPGPTAQLIAPKGIDAHRVEQIAAGECLTRDLINTPASDMGPIALEGAIREVAQQFDATVRAVEGDALLEQNFPMIHTVGRASSQAPRLIELTWGSSGPALTLVGKGVSKPQT